MFCHSLGLGSKSIELDSTSQTAKAIVALQPRAKLHTDARLTTRGAGDAQGLRWDNICHDLAKYGVESEESVDERLHSFLSVLLTSHTPASSTTATPATPGLSSTSGTATPLTPGLAGISMNNAPIFDRAFSSVTTTANVNAKEKPGTVAGLPRPGMPRTPTTPAGAGLGTGVVLVVTHQECLSSFLRILTAPCPVPAGAGNGAKKPPIDLHVPETIDFKHAEGEDHGQVGNTSVAILRIWWEDEGDGKLEPRGRLEAWGSEEHLHDDDDENDVEGK
ncbi:hypothetical protein I316_05217 [Kwoniella heveanensis BCC8398]|uniref:Phosphoglycerate mutase n=1 Tax=Kwoniella heveanensis BCC8398 TaxID=1296120 RepID=A0A1B9GQ34_9TREE|nr:hypothetical protein I316_05217 [Kwoniella heveanensis BCC8398]